MWQNLIVYLIVMFAAIYATWRWMPITARASVLSRAISIAKRLGLSTVGAAHWQVRASAKTGCGSCGPCKACTTNAKQPA